MKFFPVSLGLVLTVALTAPVKAIATPTFQLAADTTPAQLNAAATATDWVEQGNILLNLAEYEAALTAFDRATQLDPTLTTAWVQQSRAQEALGETQSALHSLQWALILDPTLSEARERLQSLRAVIANR